ncbi:MAG TPA: aspartate carbamoyltransferase catalytic subunit [Planctomycetota bacterium]|nr:aspartate carbamoyltransferase catalytic subunit [Planctomycetota bacterium]
MPSAPRSLVSIEDLSVGEILELFRHAEEFGADLTAWTHLCRGAIMATLFLEPSTRTRLSFEAAMHRLGGGVITVSDASSSSQAKGESLADTVRVVGGPYADIVVIRHPDDGAARVAARYARVPVINGGDGAHEHPTQTLCDLYTLWKEKGRLEGLDVVLCGDLRHSRTVHSFAYALARFRANIVTIPYPGLEMPQYVLDRLRREFGVQAIAASVGELPGLAGKENSVAYLTASRPHQLALFTQPTIEQVQHIDAIYMTRAQRERHAGDEVRRENYPRLSGESLRSAMFKDARVMHPLPRLDEISHEVDDDPRAVYFRQAELGVPIRMALMAFLLGQIRLDAEPPARFAVQPGLSFDAHGGLRCRNERCITNREGSGPVVRDFRLVEEATALLACAYCDKEVRAAFVGNAQTKEYVPVSVPAAARIDLEHRVYFVSEEQAATAAYRPAATGDVAR